MHMDRILQSWRFCPLASLLVGMGYFEQAVVRINEVVFIAEEISRPFSLRYARCFAGAIYSGRYEPQVTIQYAEQAIALAQAQGFQHFQVMGTLLYGWALAVLGKQEERTKHLQQALEVQKRIGFEVGRSFFLTLLSKVYCNAGLTEQRLQIVAEELGRMQHKGEGFTRRNCIESKENS